MIIQKIQSQPKFGMAVHIPPHITSHNERNLLDRGLKKAGGINEVYVNTGSKLSISLWPFKIKKEPVYLVNVVKQNDNGKEKFSSAFVMPKRDASLKALESKASYHSFVAGVKETSYHMDSLAWHIMERRQAEKIDRFVQRIKKAVIG